MGVAVFGAIFSNRLAANLAADLPPGAASQLGARGEPTASQLRALPAAVRAAYLTAFSDALGTVFLTAAGVALVAFALTWFIPQVPLRATATVPDPGEASTMNAERTTEAELTRALSVIARRENITGVYEDLAARAGLALRPADCWLLLRLHDHAPLSATTLADRLQLPESVLDPHLQRLTEQGDLAPANGQLDLTPDGRAAAERLVECRTAQLARMLGDVPDDERAELMETLHRLAASLLSGPAGRTLLAG